MNIMRSVLSVAVVAAMVGVVAVVPGTVSADDEVTQKNENTGSRSRNTNRLRLRRDHTANRTNTAVAGNSSSVTANTGGNDQNDNTTAGDQESGKVEVTAAITNDLNAPEGDDPAVPDSVEIDVDQTNKNTGPRSRNHNRARIRTSVTSNVTNTATASNSLTVNGTTGNNDQESNTTAGDQDSGDVVVNIAFDNFLN